MSASYYPNPSTPVAERFCRFTAGADQTVTAGVVTILDYDTVVTNNSTALYTNNGAGRITVAESGIYLVTAGVVIEAAVGVLNSSDLAIYRNAQLVTVSQDRGSVSVGASTGLSCSTTIALTAGDIIDARAFVTSNLGNGAIRNATATLLGANAVQVNHLSITRMER